MSPIDASTPLKSTGASDDSVVIIGGGLAGQNVAKAVVAKKTGKKVIIIQANPFNEFAVFGAYHVTRPEVWSERANTALGAVYSLDHMALEGVEYVVGTVSGLSDDNTQLLLADGRKLGFSALVVATGVHYPALTANSGEDFATREAFVKAFPNKVSAAKSIMVGGAGPVAMEVACELRRLNATAKIVMVTSGERLLGWEGTAHQKVTERLAKTNISVITGARVEGVDASKAVYEKSSYKLSNGDALNDVDIFLPYFGVPRTEFLPADMVNADRRGRMRTSLTGQSPVAENIFSVGTGDQYTISVIGNIEAEAAVVATNVASLLAGKACDSKLSPTPPEDSVLYVHMGLGQYTVMNIGQKGAFMGFCGYICGCCSPICPCCACCGWPCQFPASECQGSCMEKLLLGQLKAANFHAAAPAPMAAMSRD